MFSEGNVSCKFSKRNVHGSPHFGKGEPEKKIWMPEKTEFLS